MTQTNSISSKALAQRLSNLDQATLGSIKKDALDTVGVLDALLQIKTYVEDIVNETKESSLAITLKNEDVNGWPSFQLHAFYSEDEIGKLTIGAQDRRNGVVIFFRNSHLDKSIELSPSQYMNEEELNRTLKKVFREFVDEIEDIVVKGVKSGAFDKTEDLELADLNLENSLNESKEKASVEMSATGIYHDSSNEDEEDTSLEDLDLFGE